MFFLLFFYRTEEVFSWLFEIADDAKEIGDGGKIVWSVMYLYDTSKLKDAPIDNAGLDDNKRRLIAKLEINKDDIQAVLPMAKVFIIANIYFSFLINLIIEYIFISIFRIGN